MRLTSPISVFEVIGDKQHKPGQQDEQDNETPDCPDDAVIPRFRIKLSRRYPTLDDAEECLDGVHEPQ